MIHFQKKFELQQYNTLKLKSQADRYISASDSATLKAAIAYARAQQLVLLPLGDGSNVVLDHLPETLVVDISLCGITLLTETESDVLVKVAAGENWQHWINYCLQQGWHGLENLTLIPGRVGAAPIQNIGAYGCEVSEYIEAVDILLRDNSGSKTLSKADCQFGYRDSVFKHQMAEKAVITAVVFRLKKKYSPVLSHSELSAYFHENLSPSADEMVAAVINIRRKKLPDPERLANAGSFFKNPKVDAKKFVAIVSRYPDMPHYHSTSDNLYKIPAAWLIERCGYKGKRLGALGMHENQALVLVNYNDSKHASCATEVLSFASQISTEVEARFGLSLEIEPQCYPC